VGVDAGIDVREDTPDTGVVLSGDEVTVMTVYEVEEVDGVPPLMALVVIVLGAADSADVWLHSPLPLESV
jgi:hypothetical protein